LDGDYTELLPLIVNEEHFADPDPLVDAEFFDYA
jgi:hypothetical protein